jgi:phosphoribosylglycinamide formyltransferase 1
MSSIRLVLLASGSGSNAENIINYFSDSKDVKVSLIISNRADAYVHQRAEHLGVPSVTMSKAELSDASALLRVLREYRIDFIVLAGFLLKVPNGLMEAFPNRIVNIHPALLPKFGGKGMYGERVHQAVVEAGEKQSGITIHFVNENYDDGTIIYQATCPVLPADTPADVASKVHALEYQYYPVVLDRILREEFLLR